MLNFFNLFIKKLQKIYFKCYDPYIVHNVHDLGISRFTYMRALQLLIQVERSMGTLLSVCVNNKNGELEK